MTHDYGMFDHYFKGISFTSDDTGYIKNCESTKILKTTDAGVSWIEVNSISLPWPPNELYFFNDTIGFAGGYQYISKTTDGGATWNSTTLSSISIYQIFFPSINIGYFCSDFEIYKTLNCGSAWNNINVPIFIKPKKLFFTNDTIGFVISDTAKGIYKTIDGGANWGFIPINTQLTFHNLFFLNDSVGFVYGRNEIWKTVDRGNNWNEISNGFFDTTLYKVVFRNENLAYAITATIISGSLVGGEDFYIYKTSDGCLNWEAQPYLADSVWIRDITFTNDSTGYGVGGDKFNGTTNGVIIKTTNGGTAGINHLKKNQHFICYPNPARETLSIETTAFFGETTLALYNMNGQEVLKDQITNNKTTIDLSGLTSGVYFLKLMSEKVIEVKKIVIE
jgi:photosystem II stability/assembly factor-like uncharacterized protein